MASPNIAQLRPLRRAEYDQLVALGAFQDERIELLDGELVRLSPIGPSHAETVARLCEYLLPALSGRARVFVQAAFAAGDSSEPQPDLAIVPLGNYRAEHPARAYLLIEVSESSLAQDRGRKARLYAESCVPEYWIFNLVESVVEVHTEPLDGAYQRVTRHAPGAVIAPLAFPDLALRVDDFLT
ncbi:MAG TPA: Uma2 family endonuclease [Polyangiaceae bacterium]